MNLKWIEIQGHEGQDKEVKDVQLEFQERGEVVKKACGDNVLESFFKYYEDYEITPQQN